MDDASPDLSYRALRHAQRRASLLEWLDLSVSDHASWYIARTDEGQSYLSNHFQIRADNPHFEVLEEGTGGRDAGRVLAPRVSETARLLASNRARTTRGNEYPLMREFLAVDPHNTWWKRSHGNVVRQARTARMLRAREENIAARAAAHTARTDGKAAAVLAARRAAAEAAKAEADARAAVMASRAQAAVEDAGEPSGLHVDSQGLPPRDGQIKPLPPPPTTFTASAISTFAMEREEERKRAELTVAIASLSEGMVNEMIDFLIKDFLADEYILTISSVHASSVPHADDEHSPHARRSARTWYPFGQPPA